MMDFDKFCRKYGALMDEFDDKNPIKLKRLNRDDIVSIFVCLYILREEDNTEARKEYHRNRRG